MGGARPLTRLPQADGESVEESPHSGTLWALLWTILWDSEVWEIVVEDACRGDPHAADLSLTDRTVRGEVGDGRQDEDRTARQLAASAR